MKKILLAVTAALAITSCSQNEEFENPAQKAEIGFKTVVAKSTRASEVDLPALQAADAGFKIHAYDTSAKKMGEAEDVDLTAEGTVFMDGVTAKWDATVVPDGAWKLDPTGPYYWPLDEYVQFFAYSPDVTYKEPAANKYPAFTYTIAEVANQKDIVAAYTKNAKKPAVGTDVTLKFKHILTQINFKLKGKDTGYTYTVTKIELSGIKNAGTFTYKDYADENAAIGSWAPDATTASYTYAATYTDFDSTADLDKIATGSNSLMLMPQTLTADAKIVITYSTTYNNKPAFDSTKEVSLKDITWNAGEKILYTLSLPGGGEAVSIVASVSSWNDSTANNDKDAN